MTNLIASSEPEIDRSARSRESFTMTTAKHAIDATSVWDVLFQND